jgi:hypothetical protein
LAILRQRTVGHQVFQVEPDFQQFVEKNQAQALVPVYLLAEVLIGTLGISRKVVELPLDFFPESSQGLVEQLVLALVGFAQGDNLLTQTVNH